MFFSSSKCDNTIIYMKNVTNWFFYIVCRYLGEDDDVSITKKSHSQALLLKLQQKAKERQSKSLTEQDPPEERTKKKTLKKKNKSDNQHLQCDKKRKLEYDNLKEAVEVKKKKKKKGSNEDNAEDKVKISVFPGVFLIIDYRQYVYYCDIKTRT